MSQGTDYTVSQLLADTKDILSQEGATREGLTAVGVQMQLLAQRPDMLEQGIEQPPGNAVRERQLHLEPDNTLVLGMGLFRKDQPTIETTEMHSHGTWGVFCCYRGREWYGLWERVDTGEREGYAELTQIEYRMLTPGDFTVMTDPPADIHTHAPVDEEFWLIGMFGNNAARAKRSYYTPQWKVQEGVPGIHERTAGARLSKVGAQT